MKSISGSIHFLTLALALTATGPVLADRDHGGHRGHPGWHGNRGHGGGYDWHGDGHDWNRWRSGYWNHGWHDGRLGWWWVVGGLWAFYPAPVYPYPSPPVVVVQEPSPPPVVVQPNPPASVAPGGTQYWYHCQSPKGYYPYVTSCPGGWRPVDATPPGVVP